MSLPISPYGNLKGESRVSDRIRRLEERLEESELKDGVGYKVRRLRKGVSLIIDKPPGGGGGGEGRDVWA